MHYYVKLYVLNVKHSYNNGLVSEKTINVYDKRAVKCIVLMFSEQIRLYRLKQTNKKYLN